MGDIDRSVGQKLTELREEYCLQQSTIANYLGIAVQDYRDYETGKKRISTAYLHRLAQMFGRRVGDFLPARPNITRRSGR